MYVLSCRINLKHVAKIYYTQFVVFAEMPRSCAAYGCKNKDTKESKDKEIKFYCIPVRNRGEGS